MFESPFVTETPGTRRAWSLSTAAVLQAIIVGTALVVPLLFIPALPAVVLRRPAAPVAPMALVETPQELRSSGSGFSIQRTAARPFTAPRGIPNQIAMLFEEPVLAGGGGAAPYEPGLPGGIPGVTTESPVPIAPPAPRPIAAKAPAVEARVYRVGGDVQAPLLVREVRPPYPPLARQARIAGTVRLEAVIAKDGLIQSLRLLSGHPLLAAAALDAVRQWRYRAATLNGEAVDVALSIEVNFTLRQ